jgi:hypothetical protein
VSALARQQQLFWASVRVDPAPLEVDTAFITRGGLSGRERLAVYRTAYWVRQVGALQQLFPSVVRLFGEGPFARHASHYLAQHPSNHWAIEQLGRDFASWLSAEVSSDVGRLAAIDWLRFSAVIAPDQQPLQVDAARLLETTVQLSAHVGVCVVTAAQLGQSDSALEWNDATPGLVVWRAGHVVTELLVDAQELAALVAANQGVLFPRWCELMVEGGLDDQAVAARAVSYLQHWLARGWLVSNRSTP